MMDFGSVVSILINSLMAMVPIVLTSVGAVWSERAGVVSIGYEGVLLMSAFFGAIVAEITGGHATMGLIGGAWSRESFWECSTGGSSRCTSRATTSSRV